MIVLTSFFVPFALPTLNELEAARGKIATANGSGDSTRWNAYNEKKRRLQADVVAHILSQRVPRLPPAQRVVVDFVWHCPDRCTDPDNIAAGGRKIIMDAMARTRTEAARGRVGGARMRENLGAGIVHCDGWHCIAGFSDRFVSESHPGRVGVRVTLGAHE